MHTQVSKLVALSVEKYYMTLTKHKKYVGFMATWAKKFPDPYTVPVYTVASQLL